MKELKRYKVKIVLKYSFDLDGSSKEDIREQVGYILTKPHILTLPGVKGSKKVKVKEIFRKGKDLDE